MSVIKPFRAYRPRPEQAREVASFPYDVLSSQEARELARGNPISFLHVCKPEIDLDPSIDVHDDRVYARGRENLRRLIADGTLGGTRAPASTSTSSAWGTTSRRASSPVQRARVRAGPHQEARAHAPGQGGRPDAPRHGVRRERRAGLPRLPGPQGDRPSVVDAVRARPPAYDFVASDGIGHALWVVSEPAEIEALVRLFAEIPALYVADGHHRTAAAVRHGQKMRAAHPGGRGDEPYEFFMAVVFPHDQLQDPRLQPGGEGPERPERRGVPRARSAERFVVRPAEAASARARRAASGCSSGGRWHRLEARARDVSRRRSGAGARRLDPAGQPARARPRHRRPAQGPAHRFRRRHPRPGRAGEALPRGLGGRLRAASHLARPADAGRRRREWSCRPSPPGSSRSCAAA